MIQINSTKAIGLIPSDIKIFHIIGIGGIGMSAIAFILNEHGFVVRGSDMSEGQNINKLRDKNIECFIGHSENNIQNADIIVYSSAISIDNPEMVAAKRLKKIILSRAEILNYLLYSSYNICISGMHGKTTTSSMMALIMEHAKVAHLSVIGGIMQYNQANYIVHKNFQWCVIEADESDDTFIKIPSTVAVITNISAEHLDYHLTFENIKYKFQKFVEQIPFYGFAVICAEDRKMQEFIDQAKNGIERKIFTYLIEDENINYQVDYVAKNILISDLNQMSFDVYFQGDFIASFDLNIFGRFNIYNALANIAVSHQLKIDLNIVKSAISCFKTTKRRFEIIGTLVNNILLVDDYAHHPREIDANIETALILAKKRKGKLIVILQPHRYSRVQKLLDAFASNKLCELTYLVMLPIYGSGEKEIKGISSEAILNKIKINTVNSKKDQYFQLAENYSQMKEYLLKHMCSNDLLIFMGAGDINLMAQSFFHEQSNI